MAWRLRWVPTRETPPGIRHLPERAVRVGRPLPSRDGHLRASGRTQCCDEFPARPSRRPSPGPNDAWLSTQVADDCSGRGFACSWLGLRGDPPSLWSSASYAPRLPPGPGIGGGGPRPSALRAQAGSRGEVASGLSPNLSGRGPPLRLQAAAHSPYACGRGERWLNGSNVNTGRKLGHFHRLKSRPPGQSSQGHRCAGLGSMVDEFLVSQAIGVSLQGQDFGMMHEPIDHGGGDDRIAEDLTPSGERLVGRHDH